MPLFTGNKENLGHNAAEVLKAKGNRGLSYFPSSTQAEFPAQ